MTGEQSHIPVMLDDVLAALAPSDGAVYVDGTFGAGGYSCALLDAADCRVIAIDRDGSARRRADEVAETYGDRFMFLQGRFGDVRTLLQAAGVDKVDGFVLDLGVSSMQLDEQDRGFSFRYDAPLDMRMDQDADAPTAADIIKTWPEEELANVIYRYGEEPFKAGGACDCAPAGRSRNNDNGCAGRPCQASRAAFEKR